MSRAKPCPVCGPVGGGGFGREHDGLCTPSLRRLVRAADKWERRTSEGHPISCQHEGHAPLIAAVRAWRKKK